MKISQIVGEIMTNDFPTKPKKILIVAVAFVTGFIIINIFSLFYLILLNKMQTEQIIKF